MPGLDRTGPRGMGSMTGGGKGLCNPLGIRARSYGFRKGYGFRGRMAYPYGYPYPETNPYMPQPTREEELSILREQSQAIRDQLDQIESRITEIKPSE